MYAIDTLAAVQRLEQAGLEKPAAEAITSLFAEGITATIGDLATKSDLLATKSDLQAMKFDLQADIQAAFQSLKAHITYIVVVANITTVLLVALLLKLL